MYHKLQRKNIDAENEENYIVGIAKNIIKRHYRKVKNENSEISINEYENMEVSDDINIEDNFITQENAKDVWNYIENKDIITTKVFYLYYILGYKIDEIANEMNLNLSNVKSRIYRNIKEKKKIFGKEMI